MSCVFSVLSQVPVLKKYFSRENPEVPVSSRKGLECIAPLFRTVQETPQPIPAQITGTIPRWLTGSLLRNGPGRFEFGEDTYNHWFDGMALMHKFMVDDGSVTYMSKFLQSETYKANKSQKRIASTEFGTLAAPDPGKNDFQRFISTFKLPRPSDNGNINFLKYKSDYYVSTETNFIHKVDPEMLETRERVDLSSLITVNGATAHPHYEPDGTVYNMGNSYGKRGIYYNIIRVPAHEPGVVDTKPWAQVVCSIPAKEKMKCSYYHSFGMTEQYIVFVEQPIKMNVLKIITSNITGSLISDALTWEPKYGTIFNVVNKHTGEIHPVAFHAEAFATLHQINAFEDQGCIVCDLICQNDGGVINILQLENMRKDGEDLDKVYNALPKPFPRRFVLPLDIDSDSPTDVDLNPLRYTSATAVKQAGGKVWCTPENLYDPLLEELGGLEFPSINYCKYNTKKYQYFYGCGIGHLVGSCLVKVNVESKNVLVWQEDGFYPSEPVFVPCPGGSEEDDGVILSVVVTPRQEKSAFLLILDAKSFAEVGRAEVPVQIPYGFHGLFVTEKQRRSYGDALRCVSTEILNA